MNAVIHSFESLATLDGAGLRYAVFFAGCPLRCVYCHNPDTWEMIGEKMSAEELAGKIKRYKPYFKSEGGVTFSGGEPMLQAEFILEMIPLLKNENINYAIDTSGAVELTDVVKKVYSEAQMVILDLKFWDDESYRKYTGVGIGNTIKTLEFLNSIGKRTWVRTVVVPGINDTETEKYLKHLNGIGCVEKYELLPFHTMGFFKYEGMVNPLEGTPPLDKEVLLKLQKKIDENMKKMQPELDL